ncbi:MAG: Cof-type HAD-IIB family hydrolase [Erysipelotrichaceae bacterium]|nr:Cof-type HAD-IIB family hydrolase [Erysipelotrichaceae bacterium]
MEIKAVFFDIDGTLIDVEADGISIWVKDTLHELQDKGIKIFYATGRPPFFLPTTKHLEFDGAICFNGAYCYDKDNTIFCKTIRYPDVYNIVYNARRMHKVTGLCSLSFFGTNGEEDTMEEYMEFSGHRNVVLTDDDFEKFMRKSIFQMMVCTTPDQDAQLLKGITCVKAVRWWNQAVDLIPAECSKSAGIKKVMDYYGFDMNECMAFGDGGNDIDMIEAAGIGVAMGNASDEVKKHADYVTATCRNDGIIGALKHYGLIS